jgi:protein-S-isoprenylcysteine O-methyltransferase Ste14
VPIINSLFLLPRNPELIAERAQFKSARPWDEAIMLFITPLPFIAMILAGLDVRFGWTEGFPLSAQFLGLMFTILGYGLVSWAMVSNKYFSSTVRIQTERDHRVVSGGPYRYLRHPGYLGMIMASLAMPILLGSFWALIPMLLLGAGYVARSALEDRTLKAELNGYEAYAKQTRYRLVPWLW